MKTKILTLLKESESYISGQELCNSFGVSRTAVWKAINQLKEEGYNIEAVKNRGYRLVEYKDIYSYSGIKSALQTEFIGRELDFNELVDSTNNKAKLLCEKGAVHGTLVAAEVQSAGKGRRGRGWESPKGSGIWFSIILRPDFSPKSASMLTLVMGIAVASAVNELDESISCMIKWPNDIVLNNKKICGILTEMNAEMDYINYVIIGTGINVNTECMPNSIKASATSIKIELERDIERADLLNRVLQNFEKHYKLFLKHESMSGLLEQYNSLLINKDKEVRVLDPKGEYTGIARGINELGELLVERQDGRIVNVYAGEVSVRGLYGYT